MFLDSKIQSIVIQNKINKFIKKQNMNEINVEKKNQFVHIKLSLGKQNCKNCNIKKNYNIILVCKFN